MKILKEAIPHLYLDSNVIIDIIQGQRHDSIYLFKTILKKKWLCSTSIFSVMEVLDVMQENEIRALPL